MSRGEVDRRLEEQVAGAARKAFAGHGVEVRLDQGHFWSWRCKSPGSWLYGFDVTLAAGHLLLTGDVGLLVLAYAHPDPIPWLRTAAGDLHYLASKVPPEMRPSLRAFSEEKARAYVAEEMARLDRPMPLALAGELRGLLDREGGHAGPEFLHRLYDSGREDAADMPDLAAWDAGFLWKAEALRWWLGRV